VSRRWRESPVSCTPMALRHLAAGQNSSPSKCRG
jgi:hypothetical protein